MDPYSYDDEEEEVLPFVGLDKTTALQQCRVFNAIPLDEATTISSLISLLYLMSRGVTLSVAEATNVFFMSTKLFQSKNPKLRRLHYVLLKELSPLVEAKFVASNSLMIDIKEGTDVAKSNAIRTLFTVMDSTMYNSMERTIAENMMFRNPNVASAALVTGLHMAEAVPDMARKWSTQLAEVMKGRTMAQYPAVALLHRIRKNDRLSVARLIEDVQQGLIQSPLTVCLVIKMCGAVLQEDFGGSMDVYEFVVTMITRSSDVAKIEAIKCLCALRNVSDREYEPLINQLQYPLRSTSPIVRFAAIRAVAQLSTTHPDAVLPILSAVEPLVADPNGMISTWAITTLLKTGNEATIERLITQLSSGNHMAELDDEYKFEVVDTMRVLNAKYPRRYETLLAFLYRALSEEGTSTLKQHVVDTMMDIARSNPKSNEAVLMHLADFIDDCEFAHITKRVLMHFGEEVPRCKDPRRFVRYVYNHATLEQPEVRAVAVTTLAKLAARVPQLRRSILPLLRRMCGDSDDEVRDRAVLYVKLFLSGDEALLQSLVDDVAVAVAKYRASQRRQIKLAAADSPGKTSDEVLASIAAVAPHGEGGIALTPAVLQGRDAMRHVRQLRDLGEPVHSSAAEPLTDADNEYVVTVMKHTYAAHIVLQFKVKNMMDESFFRNVTVLTETEELEGTQSLYAIPIEAMSPGETKYAYVVLQYTPSEFPSGTVMSVFRFCMAESADGEAGDEDEFPLEDFDVDVKDFIAPTHFSSAAMDSKWEGMAAAETEGTYSLRSMKNLTEAAQQLADFFGMYVEGGVPEKVTTATHTLKMAGTLANATESVVMVRARVFIASDNTVALHLALRGGSEEEREYLAGALLG